MDTDIARILLVDDDEDHIALVRRAFEQRDAPAKLLIATNLSDASRQIAAAPPDLVIADLHLPDGRGSQLLQSESGDMSFPVIILTGYGDEQMAVDAMKAGALDYVVKSPETFRNMPHIAERALREWGHIEMRKKAEVQAKIHLAELAHVSRLSTMGEIVSELAHEINQPLYAIVNFAEASTNRLEKSPHGNDDELLGWLRRISEQATRAGEVILSLSRFIRKLPPRQTDHDVNTIIREVIRLVEVEATKNEVTIELELTEWLPRVTVDAVQIDQVVVNLVRNAIEAMSEIPADHRQLTVRTLLETADDGREEMVTVCVTDQGKGIDPEKQDRLFEAYYTTKPAGMGMGLTISRSIIKAHAGRLWATSEQQRGTTFCFSLPLSKEPSIHE